MVAVDTDDGALVLDGPDGTRGWVRERYGGVIADCAELAGATVKFAGIEMSLVAEPVRERFLHDALDPIVGDYHQIVIDTPPNLGLLTVNALVCADTMSARSCSMC